MTFGDPTITIRKVVENVSILIDSYHKIFLDVELLKFDQKDYCRSC